MSFPTTRHTLIRRIASSGNNADWQQFHRDYWGAICRFARRTGGVSEADAEDVASQTFDAILNGKLLDRWTETRTAKLRTLICRVVRNNLANRCRVEQGRERIVAEHAVELQRFRDPEIVTNEQDAEDQFYTAWADEVVHQALERLLEESSSAGRGDIFRVLFSRLCEDMTFAEIAAVLDITPVTAENHFRRARERLSEILRDAVRSHVRRYVEPGQLEAEFQHEWLSLGEYLQKHGGLEAAVQQISQASI